MTRPLATLAFAALAVACQPGDNGERGGEREQQLVAATVAADADGVGRLLAAGADPNKMALHDGHYQSAWKLALRQARRNRPATVAIVRAMLAAHASPRVAFGEEHSNRAIGGSWKTLGLTPILEAVSNAEPDVMRALMSAGLPPREAQLALVLAVESLQVEAVHILVEAGVDVNCHPSANTPLTAAIAARNTTLMTYLEQHGAREKP